MPHPAALLSIALLTTAQAEEAPALVAPAPAAPSSTPLVTLRAGAFEIELPPSVIVQDQAERDITEEEEADHARCERAHRDEHEEDDDHNGGYGAFHRGWSALDDQLVRTAGGRGGWVIDHRWVIGGYGFHSEVERGDARAAPRRAGEADRIDLGGVFVERVLWPGATAHPTLELAVGSGRVTADGVSAGVLHAGAAARLELRAASWARVAFGPRIDLAVLPTAPPGLLLPHSTVGADVLFKFGWF